MDWSIVVFFGFMFIFCVPFAMGVHSLEKNHRENQRRRAIELPRRRAAMVEQKKRIEIIEENTELLRQKLAKMKEDEILGVANAMAKRDGKLHCFLSGKRDAQLTKKGFPSNANNSDKFIYSDYYGKAKEFIKQCNAERDKHLII